MAKDRSERLHKLVRSIAKKRNSLWKGWQGEIIVDEIGKAVQGRNYAYKPVVIQDKLALGAKAQVKVYDFSSFSLKGKII